MKGIELIFRLDGLDHAARSPTVYPVAGDIVCLKTGRYRVTQRVIDYGTQRGGNLRPETVVAYIEPYEAE